MKCKKYSIRNEHVLLSQKTLLYTQMVLMERRRFLTKKIINSAHADGVLAPGSAHAGPSARPPINMSGNFPAHVSAESPSNISPNPTEVISEVSEP